MALCGRYYVDFQVSEEIEKMVPGYDRKLIAGASGDIRPSEKAPVILARGEELSVEEMLWGFPGFQGNGLIINARAEGVLEKAFFRDCVRNCRCIIPARGFYEWNRAKLPVYFK